jgi:hypothetical protein
MDNHDIKKDTYLSTAAELAFDCFMDDPFTAKQRAAITNFEESGKRQQCDTIGDMADAILIEYVEMRLGHKILVLDENSAVARVAAIMTEV